MALSSSARWELPLQRFYLRSVFSLNLFFVLGTIVLVLLTRGTLSRLDVELALLVGGPVGLLVSTLEVFVYPQLFARLAAGLRLVVSLGLYLLIFWFLLFLTRSVFGHFQASGRLAAFPLEQRELQSLARLSAGSAGRLLVRLLTGFGILTLFTSLLFQISNKLGRGTLIRLLLGRYHRPVAEQRVFLFVDVKGSTALAEELGNERYSHLIRDFFHDMGAPIVASRGEIYQYVGDEVVVSWEWQRGIQDAHCVRCFFGMQHAIDRRRAYYLREYGTVPAFKAGLHGGPVMATQVGAVKSELVFHGDVLNTTARIQGKCNALHARLLVSAPLYAALPHLAGSTFRAMGCFALRGKAQPVELYSVENQ